MDQPKMALIRTRGGESIMVNLNQVCSIRDVPGDHIVIYMSNGSTFQLEKSITWPDLVDDLKAMFREEG